MLTRIDKILGTDVFQSIQDKVPKSIGIMVGMAYTSGGLVTGKRKYEKSFVCREIINPCFRHRDYACHEGPCHLRGTGCFGGQGNTNCTKSDQQAGDEARKTMMTALYRCHFGLANFAIPVPIGTLSTITLYGGQFRIDLKKKEDPIIEEYDRGKRVGISQDDFVRIVDDIYKWRTKKQNTPFVKHLSLAEKNKIISEYLSDPLNIQTVPLRGSAEEWRLEKLENVLREHYGLSLVENWHDFLYPPVETEIEERKKDTAAQNFYDRIPDDPRIDREGIRRAAEEALKKYDQTMKPYFGYETKNPELDKKAIADCEESLISLKKALSAMETLKELALLISRTANIVFYKDTYFMLRNLWNNHPISVIESFDERWLRCEKLIHELDTSGKEVLLPVKVLTPDEIRNQPYETQKHLNLVKELTKNLMFFAYKMLSEDFRSTILLLQKNYDLKRRFPNEEQEVMQKFIDETENGLSDIKVISSFFIRDLLQAKYEQLIQDKKENGNQGSDSGDTEWTLVGILRKIKDAAAIKEFDETQGLVEDYIDGESTRLNSPLSRAWTIGIFEMLENTASNNRIHAEDILLNFFNLIFKGKRRNGDKQDMKRLDLDEEELERLNVNLRWADREIRGQVENISTSVLQFDICQSLLKFMQKLRENTYASRFEVIRKLAFNKRGFQSSFLPPADAACKYFVDHGIEHALRVYENVCKILKSAHGETKFWEDEKIVYFPQSPEERLIETRKGLREKGCGCVDNVCSLPLWQYYLSCSALLHDVGMFSTQRYEEIFGGPATIRRCHGAFSGKKIIEESAFEIFGNELDRQIIAQICAFHHGSADLSLLPKNIQPLAAILRLADELDVCRKRVIDIASDADKVALKKITAKQLNPKGIYQALETFNKQQGEKLEIPAEELKTEDVQKLEKEVLGIAEKLAEKKPEFESLWPVNIPPFEFVQRQPNYEDETIAFIDVLRACSEIKSILDAPSHYRRHWCVDEVKINNIKRGNKRYLIPEISLADLDVPSQADKVKMSVEDAPKVLAEIKMKFRGEIEFIRSYLEPMGIHFKSPRTVRRNKTRNLLFINAPSSRKMKFIGAPTSLLYAIAPTVRLIENNEYRNSLLSGTYEYGDVNIEIWDPECFGISEEDELRDIMKDLNPKIVGISNTSSSHYNALKIAAIIKDSARQEKSNTLVIFGGPHENVCCEETISRHFDVVDISIGGIEEQFEIDVPKNGKTLVSSYRTEAEYALCRIVTRALNCKVADLLAIVGSVKDYEDVPGKFKIAFYNPRKQAPDKILKERSSDIELDSLPFMPRYLLDDQKRYDYDIFQDHIRGRLRKTAQVITTRGCPHRCVFCSSSGRSSRRRISNVLAELASLRNEGYEAIFFDDSTFADKCQDKLSNGTSCRYTDGDPCPVVMSKEKFKEQPVEWKSEYEYGKCGYAIKLCHEMIKKDFGFVWGCQTRADVVHDKLLDLMKRSGCVYVYFGVESMNQDALTWMLKDLTVDQIKNGIRETTNKGLDVGISLVFGLEQDVIDKTSLLNERLAVAKRLPSSISNTIDEIHDILCNAEYAGSRVNCVSINVAVVYPGTQLARIIGTKIPDFDKSSDVERDATAFEFEDAGPVMPCLELKPENKGIESRVLMKLTLDYCRERIGNKLI